MLEFSEKLTLIPSSITEVDIETLRGHGFSDRDILSIILAGAYRNYIVRVADALGIELNPTVDYAPELIQAFGLNEAQARETLYGDRQERKAMEDAEQTPPPPSDARLLSDGRSSSSNCWIETDPPGEVAEDFIRARDKLVQLSETSPMHNLAQAFGVRPAALDVTADYMSLLGFGGSGLDMGLEGLIGLSVAHTLSCHYMAVHHAQTLLADGMATEKIHGLVDQAMISAPEKALSDPREHEAVRFCVQLSQSPWTMARSDLDPLRNVGFTDKEIVTIVAGASLENFLCRVADAVGLQLEAQLEGPTVHDLL